MDYVTLNKEKYEDLLSTIDNLRSAFDNFQALQLKNQQSEESIYLLNKQLSECCEILQFTYALLSKEQVKTVKSKYEDISVLIKITQQNDSMRPYFSQWPNNRNQNMVSWNLFQNVIEENVELLSELNDFRKSGPSIYKKLNEDLKKDNDSYLEKIHLYEIDIEEHPNIVNDMMKERDDLLERNELLLLEIEDYKKINNDLIREKDDWLQVKARHEIDMQEKNKDILHLKKRLQNVH